MARPRSPHAIANSSCGISCLMTLDDALERASVTATELLRTTAAEVDRTARWPAEGIRALQAAGLGGLVVPRDAGGEGHGLYAVAKVCEVLGRECGSTAIAFGMHLVGSAVIAVRPTAGQRQRYLEPIARGEHLTTLALSEPGTGAHLYFPQSRLERARGGYRLSGEKSFVTSAGFADSYVVSAAGPTDDADVPGDLSCVVVREGADGLTWSGSWSGWGMRGNAARSARLDGLWLEDDDLLGQEGDEIWYVFQVILPYFLVAMAGTYVGIAESAVEEARAHLVSRTYAHSGRALAQHAIPQHRLGTLWGALVRTRALVFEAARMADEGHDQAVPMLFSAKAEVAEAAERITADVMTLLGGRGYSADHRVHRLYRDVRAAHVMAPTTDLLRTWTGRALLDVPLLGD